MSYEPKPKTAAMLNFALTKVKALPYKVSARYAFYRIVQGFAGYKKGDYGKFLQLTAKARKGFWSGWNPETFVDDTRSILKEYGLISYASPIAWFESMADRSPYLEIADHFDVLPLVMFEAKAMVRQFQYYLNPYRVPLCAFGGDPSIHYKWSIAKFIEKLEKKWPDKTIRVLYFGDYDRKGEKIPEWAIRDIRKWCSAEFEFTRVGINKEHIRQFDIEDSPNEPGKYQWEALDDFAAKELILGSIKEVWDLDVVKKLKRTERKAGKIWNDVVKDAIKEAKEAVDDWELDFPDEEDDDNDDENDDNEEV